MRKMAGQKPQLYCFGFIVAAPVESVGVGLLLAVDGGAVATVVDPRAKPALSTQRQHQASSQWTR